MTIAKEFAAKLTVAFVAVAMVLSAYAPAAQAQTTEELQAMINDLLAQVAALQTTTGQGSTSVASGVCPYTWTRDLSQGATGADVMKLQQFLNADLDTRVAASGAGSVGAETEYYGPATAAAVSKMQVKYRAEVLSPSGLVNPTGYFGPSSRAKANSVCTTAPVMDEDDEDMDDEDDNGPTSLGGEASLDSFEIESAEDDEVEEGAEDAPIAELTVEFVDGDAEISRLDVQLLADGDTNTNTVRPWDAFETVSLWVDGDKIAEVDASDEDDYLDEDLGTLRFSGLDIVGMEDEEVEIIVAVTAQGNLDGAELTTWDFYVTALRFFDADGVATTESDTLDIGSEDDLSGSANSSFDLEEAGFEDELIVKTSSNDPDSATLQVEDDSKSDWYTVFVFDLDTDDSINDIEINDLALEVIVGTSTGGYNGLVDDAELVIDGVTIDDVTITFGGTATATLAFDVDGDVVIDAGDRVEAQLMLRFKSLDAGNEGVTVQGRVTATNANNIVAEGADDLANTPTDQLSGSAEGERHTLRTSGVDIALEGVSASVTSVDSNTNDYGTYEIEVEVTAFEQDVFISTNPATSTSYVLQDGAGVTATTGTRSITLESSADETGGYFEINEGETETLTLRVTYTPGVANTAARLVLNSISFNETAALPDQTQTTLPATTYRTAVITMVN